MSQDLCAARRNAAEQVFADWDFGDEVVDDGNWNTDGDEWSLPVFLENYDGPTTRVVLVVRFAPSTETVTDSYVAG